MLVGIVGYGRLGQQLAKAVEKISGLSLSWVCDPMDSPRQLAGEKHSNAKITGILGEYPEDLNLVVLAASPGPEGPPIDFFLSKKINVISAPPLAPSSVALVRRQETAKQNHVRLVPLRLFGCHKTWNGFVEKISDTGNLSVVQADLKAFGPFAADVGVHRSHGSWLVAELIKLHPGKLVSVSALGVGVGTANTADMGSLRLEYDSSPLIFINLSRVAVGHELRVMALGHRSMLEFCGDLHGKTELRRHQRHIRLEGSTVYAAEGKEPEILLSDDLDWPTAALEAALAEMNSEKSINLGTEINAEKILDAAWVSLRLKGSPVALDLEPEASPGG